MIDWLLVWYACVFTGLLLVIHEPAAKKAVRIDRVSPWIADLIAYTYPIDGYTDPLFDTKPSDLDDATTKTAPLGMVHR
jgi:hypothetical protein